MDALEAFGNDRTHAQELGLLEHVELSGIYDLTLLNQVLADAGEDPIATP